MDLQGDGSNYYQHGVEEEDDEDIQRTTVPPELTPDYLETKRRAEEYLKSMEEELTVFDGLYWLILFEDLWSFLETWGVWLKRQLLTTGVALCACIAAGSIFLTMLVLLLTCVGPIRIKSLGAFIFAFVIGSLAITDSTEVAASTILGMILTVYIFLLKISTGSQLKRGKVVQEKKDQPIFLIVTFWYVGERTLWLNLSQGYIGLY